MTINWLRLASLLIFGVIWAGYCWSAAGLIWSWRDLGLLKRTGPNSQEQLFALRCDICRSLSSGCRD